LKQRPTGTRPGAFISGDITKANTNHHPPRTGPRAGQAARKTSAQAGKTRLFIDLFQPVERGYFLINSVN
jgi:hypothetical protein